MNYPNAKRVGSGLALALLLAIAPANPALVGAQSTVPRCDLSLPQSYLSDAQVWAKTLSGSFSFNTSEGVGASGVIATVSGGEVGNGTFFFFVQDAGPNYTFMLDGTKLINNANNRAIHFIPITNNALVISQAQKMPLGAYANLGTMSCTHGMHISSGDSTAQFFTQFPMQSTITWQGVSYYTPAPPPAPCEYNSAILATDPACVAPPPPPPPPTGGTGEPLTDFTPRDLKIISLAISLAVAYLIIGSFRFRSNV